MRKVLSALVAVAILGVIGYILLEKMPFPDAFLSTVSVMATVGIPAGLSTAGKLFTAALVIASVAVIINAIANFFAKPDDEEELLTGFFSSPSEGMIMKEVKIGKGSPLAGLTKSQVLQNYGAVIVGVKNKAGFDVDVPLNMKVKAGSSVLLLGSPAALLRVERKK